MSVSDVAMAGVGLIVTCGLNGARNVLLLTEKESKPWLGKLAGMRSFPMETRQSLREPVDRTLQRLLDEELTGMSAHLYLEPGFVGLYQVVKNTWLQVFHASSLSGVLPVPGFDRAVDGHIWLPLLDAVDLVGLRRGAREPLCDLLSGKRQVVRRYCAPPSLNPEPC